MSKLSQVLNNEELLTKAVKAKSRDEVKEVLREGGLEVNDDELEEITGGISKTAAAILGCLGGIAAGAVSAGLAMGAAGHYLLKKAEEERAKGIYGFRI